MKINVLIPMGKKEFFDETTRYPKWLIEVGGKLMVQVGYDNFKNLPYEIHPIFVIREDDCNEFHLDNICQIMTENHCDLIKLHHDTLGAACSCLMAVKYIDNDTPLIIANYDHLFLNGCVQKALDYFERNNADGGVLCFDTIHPRWSFVRIDETGCVVEAAEKRPLSRNGIAGFYYFRQGHLFVDAAKRSILKNAQINGSFFIAPVLNELILDNRKILPYLLKNNDYFSFFTADKVMEYNKAYGDRKENQ